MSYTITLGWWVIPLLVTMATFGIAMFMARSDGRPDPYGGGAIIGAMVLMGAAIVSLIAWLIWAVAT